MARWKKPSGTPKHPGQWSGYFFGKRKEYYHPQRGLFWQDRRLLRPRQHVYGRDLQRPGSPVGELKTLSASVKKYKAV